MFLVRHRNQVSRMVQASDDQDGAGGSYEESPDHLRERVLSQYHARRSYGSCQYQHEAEPPQRVEREGDGIGYQSACHASDGGCMGADLPPYIDEAHTIWMVSATTTMMLMTRGVLRYSIQKKQAK